MYLILLFAFLDRQLHLESWLRKKAISKVKKKTSNNSPLPIINQPPTTLTIKVIKSDTLKQDLRQGSVYSKLRQSHYCWIGRGVRVTADWT